MNRFAFKYFAAAFCFAFALAASFLRAQENPAQESLIPAPLSGVWENNGRIVTFYSEQENARERALTGIALKMFYGWYYDRTAEPASASASPRDKNDASAPQGETLITSFEETSPVTQNSGSWLMRVRYPPYRETDAIALAVIRDKLYLDFYVRYDENPDSRNNINGFWRASGTASGITASRPYYAGSIESLFITGDSVFRIRYWEVDLVPDLAVRAYFSDGTAEYAVDKYIVIGDKTFTCVQGRGTQIKQITQSPLTQSYELSDDGTLCAFSAPYLTKSAITDVHAEVAAANARKRPPPKPLFPPSDLDFHYDIIEDLRKYTPNWSTGR